MINLSKNRRNPNDFTRQIFLIILSYLKNRFHLAMRVYSDNEQMTSKRGKNKEVRYEPQASSVTSVLDVICALSE